ncbi:hypothetical protein [Roseomonas populi]|uniref:Uncharacterized protein n=1 Tax=Roseomonas populi TaxID=3121582 RepID=A0ABT1X171_9PROT|nr:hypothetical protein [Roseomonas pecuniae]MCR0981830.1 hypothetical protein [Roseomonas pecuniae]
MTDYLDLRWHGPARRMNAALAALPPAAVQAGPRVLDGIAYVLRRESEARPLPDGLEVTGAELSAAIVGVIA